MDGMKVIFSEWDRYAVSWLSHLSAAGHLPVADIDTRSITELRSEDLEQYEQAHFFAGIGGWPLAIRWAGLENTPGIWTGSPPCQPFSTAGKGRGTADERHLAPVWLSLIRECQPSVIFGEQVASAISHGWLDYLFSELEGGGYACGAAVLPACGIGAPHLRYRLFFGAVRLADLHGYRYNARGEVQPVCEKPNAKYGGTASCMADAHHQHKPSGTAWPGSEYVGGGSPWNRADWLSCRDGRFRPVESGTFPLANGIPARVGRLRGYGNALVPQLAATFAISFIEAVTG